MDNIAVDSKQTGPFQLRSEQVGESIVMVGEKTQKLRYSDIIKGSVHVRSKTLASDEGNEEFTEGADFVINYMEGTIRRIASGRIPDWSNHVLYGNTNFNHTLYEDYSNDKYTLYMDYSYVDKGMAVHSLEGSNAGFGKKLQHSAAKLKQGCSINYVVYGDSISTGAEASRDCYKYFNRFADRLRQVYPEGRVNVFMKAIGGEDSKGGLARFQDDVLPLKPDVISIGYGMNDQNIFEGGKIGVPVDIFEKNIRSMVLMLQEIGNIDIILVTPCIPNPLWIHSSGYAHRYAEAIRKVGAEFDVCVADLQSLWIRELDAGKTHESLLLNNINHPNDYGHWLYYRTLTEVL